MRTKIVPSIIVRGTRSIDWPKIETVAINGAAGANNFLTSPAAGALVEGAFQELAWSFWRVSNFFSRI
jgi:hypothetical protein